MNSDQFNLTNSTFVQQSDLHNSYGVAAVIATSVVLGIMTLVTIIGNVFVIAAIILERNLQSVANYLILSLAVADLMVAVLVMPLGAVYEISQEWTFGPQICDIWTSSDVLCCTASILHLLAIAVDRYWAVTHVHYIHSRTLRTVGTMIFLIWFASVVISLAPLFGWKDVNFERRVNVNKICIVSQDVSYQIFATMATFYVPLVVILLLYWKIFLTARNRLRNRLAQKAALPPSDLGNDKNAVVKEEQQLSGDNEDDDDCTITAVVTAKQLGQKNRVQTVLIRRESGNENGQDNLPPLTDMLEEVKTSSVHLKPTYNSQGCQTEPKPNSHQKLLDRRSQASRKSIKKHVSMEAKRERKAAKTLAIVTGAFIACWLPFFLLALIMAIFKDWKFNPHLVSFFLWLGYFNSTLNPIIYTIFSPEFRAAFQRLLCGKSTTLNHRPRHLQ